MTSETLALWLAGIMGQWAPATVPSVPPGDVARDIADAVIEDGPVWPYGETGEKRSALVLASLAYFEGARFAAYVDSGQCNEWMEAAMEHPLRRPDSKTGIVTRFPNYAVLPAGARNLLGHGDCDQGRAFSLWQIWPRSGDDMLRRESLGDRKYAAKAALYLVKRSYGARGNLSGYSGESAESHPKADIRERFAQRFWDR